MEGGAAAGTFTTGAAALTRTRHRSSNVRLCFSAAPQLFQCALDEAHEFTMCFSAVMLSR